MKKYINSILVLSLIFVLSFAPVSAFALSGKSSTGTTTDKKSSSSESETETETETQSEAETEAEVETAADKQKRGERVETYKKELKETLTAAVKARISEKCGDAQALVRKRSALNELARTARTTKFEAVVANLQAVVTALKAKNIDTTGLEANITELKAKISTFNAADTTFKQSLSDLASLDCKTDPVAFKAALEKARADQKSVLSASLEVRAYLTGTVKTTLKALKASLGA